MLRWVVLVLLLCNGIYFAWQRYLSPPVPLSAVPVVEPQGQRVALLGEAGDATRLSPSRVVPPPQAVAAASVPSPAAEVAPKESAVVTQPLVASSAPEAPSAPICRMIGPFHEVVSARQVRERLAAIPLKTDLYQINVPAKPVYWVYLGPMRTRQEAQDQHRQLLAKEIESFIITDGPLLNGVSLGFFTVPESAQTMLKRRREQGYDAKVREVARTTQELWLFLTGDSAVNFSDAEWSRLRAGTQDVELRKSLCDVVAMATKLE